VVSHVALSLWTFFSLSLIARIADAQLGLNGFVSPHLRLVISSLHTPPWLAKELCVRLTWLDQRQDSLARHIHPMGLHGVPARPRHKVGGFIADDLVTAVAADSHLHGREATWPR